jgi:hypothetical protein
VVAAGQSFVAAQGAAAAIASAIDPRGPTA